MHDETPMTTPDTPAGAQDARDLDRAIAERLGWRSEQTIHGYRWRIRDNKWGSPDNYAHDPDLVFNYLYDREIIPHYTEDMTAAMTLVTDAQPTYFSLDYSPDRMDWRAEFWFDYREAVIWRDRTSPAMAICLAWLEFATPAPPAADADPVASRGACVIWIQQQR